MKKVLIVFPLLPKYNVEFLKFFCKRYKDISLYVTADIKGTSDLTLTKYDNYDFKVIHTDIIETGPFQTTTGLSSIIKKVSPELIIYTASPRDLGQMISIIKRKFSGQKFAVWSMFHRIGGPHTYSTLYYKFLGMISNRVMTYSQIGKQYQIARGVKADKIDVIGTAIDEKKVFTTPRNINEEESIKKKYRIEDKFILLQVVRLTNIKKPYFLIDMMKELITQDNDFLLVLIGGGIMENEIKEYAKKSNVFDYILFLGPIYDENILNNWFNIANVFVIPTCIGLSAHHACSYGLPIVTDDSLTQQASEFDILADRLNCSLYKENSIVSFVEKIIELKNNDELYKRISKNAVTTVKETYTLKKRAENLYSSIFKILKNERQ